MDTLEQVADEARLSKEARVAEHGPVAGDDTDLSPRLYLERDSELSHMVIVNGGRDEALEAAFVAAAAWNAEALILCVDAHMRTVTSREEAESIEPGSMQRECHDEGACERGEIQDCFMVHRVARDGSMSGLMLPYKLSSPVAWDEPITKDDGEFEGLIVDVLREAMAKPTIPEKLGLRRGAKLEDDMQLTSDVAGCRVLAEQGHGVAMALRTEAERDIVERLVEGEDVKVERLR